MATEIAAKAVTASQRRFLLRLFSDLPASDAFSRFLRHVRRKEVVIPAGFRNGEVFHGVKKPFLVWLRDWLRL
jgi:hypothetical protein